MSLTRQRMTLFMLAVFVLMVGVATTYPPGARFMPLTVGIPAIALCLLQLYLDYRSPTAREAEEDEIREAEEKASRVVGHDVQFEHAKVIDAPMDERDMVRREVIVWAYVLSFIGGILLFGFWIAIPIFLVTFLRERAKASWTRALGMGATAAILFYLVFTKGLGIVLFNGMITTAVMERLAG